MISYNVNLLKNLLQDLSYLIETSVSFFDENFEPTLAHSVETPSDLCYIVKEQCLQKNKCLTSDEQCFEKLRKGENFFSYSCHMGFKELVLKIGKNDTTYGYVIVGPFKDNQKEKEEKERLKEICHNDQSIFEKAINCYAKIPYFSMEKFYSIKNMLTAIFDYAINNNIISEKTNLFSKEIEPYILKNYDKKITINSLCKQFFLTQKQLYKIFEDNTHKTPKHFINELRVNKALRLIITTDISLPEIASKVGIDDYNYFIKVFKAYNGHTPMFYKKH